MLFCVLRGEIEAKQPIGTYTKGKVEDPSKSSNKRCLSIDETPQHSYVHLGRQYDFLMLFESSNRNMDMERDYTVTEIILLFENERTRPVKTGHSTSNRR